jgi:ArsR family transcriptional regulator
MDLIKGLKALADETRLKILAMVSEENLCAKAIARRLEVSEPSVSQHFKKLREAGLVTGEKCGYYVHYQLRKANIDKLAEELKNFSEHVEIPRDCSDREKNHQAGWRGEKGGSAS